MILLDYPIPAFDQYLDQNKEYWASLDSRRSRDNGFVVVDLMHNNGPALISSLLVGRFAAQYYNARLAAITSDHFLDWPTPIEQVQRLGTAFGVERFFRVQTEPMLTQPNRLLRKISRWIGSKRDRTISEIARLSGHRLRQAVLDLRINDVPVGDLIYDTYLRKTGAASIESADTKLLEEIFSAYSRMAQYAKIMGRQEHIACVTSHQVYIDMGGLLRTTVKQGKIGIAKVLEVPAIVRKYRTVDDCYEYPWPEPIDLEFVREHLGSELSRRADDFFPPHQQRAEEISYFQISYGSQMLRPTEDELRARLGISPGKAVIGIIVPTFDDAPHGIPDLLYQDYGCWLEDTLRICAGVTHVEFLIRNHPYAVAAGLTKEFDRIVGPYIERYPHLKICPTEIATEVLFPLFKTVVTAASTAALEFASIGKRPVICGRTFYADLGFVERPRSVAAYQEVLKKVDKFLPLSPSQILTAKEIAYVYFKFSFQPTKFLPPPINVTGVNIGLEEISKYWETASEALRGYKLEEDSLWKNFQRMEQLGRSLMLRFDEIEGASVT